MHIVYLIVVDRGKVKALALGDSTLQVGELEVRVSIHEAGTQHPIVELHPRGRVQRPVVLLDGNNLVRAISGDTNGYQRAW